MAATGGSAATSAGGTGGILCPTGSETCPCHPDGTCDAGLTCASGLCVDVTASVGGAGAGGTRTGGAGAAGASGGRPATGGAAVGGAVTGGVTTGGTNSINYCAGVPFVFGTDATGTACVGVPGLAEPSPRDLMLLLDRSQSMTYALADGTERWAAVRAAIGQFIADMGSTSLRLGVQFLSLTGNLDLTADCDPNAYLTTAVEIGELSQTGPAVLAAMDAMVLGGQTPGAPALQGVLWHAQNWQRTNQPGRSTAVVMITDGLPTMCPVAGSTEPTVDDVVAVAQAGATDPSTPIPTYVIGVAMGANKYNLDRYAVAGSSRSAYLAGDTGNAAADILTALKSIAADPLSCSYRVPPSSTPAGPFDPSKARLVHLAAAGELQLFYAGSRGGCANEWGGFYYDDPSNPSRILLCPCTCASITQGLMIELGCPPPRVPLG